MKRCARLATLVVAALVLVLGFGTSASARPVAYPVAGCSTVLVSSTEINAGSQLGVSGTDFAAGAHLTIELTPPVVVLGHVTTDASGNFSTTVTIPADTAAGNYTVTVTGGGEICPVEPVEVNVHGTGGHHTSHLPSLTGVAIASLLILAAILMFVGYVLNSSARKKRKHHGKRARHQAASS